MNDLSRFDLTDRKALVTGAAGGIGKACAIAMAKAGADVAVIDLKDDMGRETTDEIRALGRKSIYVQCDVSDPKQVAEMVKEVVDKLGGLHIAHNNAGIGGDPIPLLDEGAIDEWKKVMNVDLFSVFYCCREEARHMIPQRYGKIVNTASMSGTIVNHMEMGGVPLAGMMMISYATAKAGVKHLTKALAVELIQHNIYVNSISPGYIITPMTQIIQDTPEYLEVENRTTPIHRQGEAEEMTGGVLYLVSDASSYTTGHDLLMDGGHTVW